MVSVEERNAGCDEDQKYKKNRLKHSIVEIFKSSVGARRKKSKGKVRSWRGGGGGRRKVPVCRKLRD